MAEPVNPDSILVKNSYYPKGLTEKQCWDYYQSVKYDLIDDIFRILLNYL